MLRDLFFRLKKSLSVRLTEVNSGFVVRRLGCRWLGSLKVDAGTKYRVQDVY